MLESTQFRIRLATHADLDALQILEKKWAEHARASRAELARRIDAFQAGFFVAENETGILASVIAHPYNYNPYDISNFKNWHYALEHSKKASQTNNALHILSGTSKSTSFGSEMFEAGIQHVLTLAKEMEKSYVITGVLLPGYQKYLQKHPGTSAETYVFKQQGARYVDPLLELYRRIGFTVPSKTHVMANYFPDSASLNYSALLVKQL